MYLLLAAAIAALPRLMFRFSGEDPIKGHPFYHEKLTREAARRAGWDGAGEPVDQLEVTMHRIGDFRRIRSVRHGPLDNLLSDADDAVVRLPLADVDVLVLEKGS